MTAAQVASILGVSRDAVYGMADRLGAVRLGGGTRPRLRFEARRVQEAMTVRSDSKGSQEQEPSTVARDPTNCRRKRMGSSPALLPIKGHQSPGENAAGRS